MTRSPHRLSRAELRFATRGRSGSADNESAKSSDIRIQLASDADDTHPESFCDAWTYGMRQKPGDSFGDKRRDIGRGIGRLSENGSDS